MFDIGLQEMLVIGVLALLVFGPSKLPELGRMVGRAMREFRRASDEFRSTVETNLNINDLDPPPGPDVAATTAMDATTDAVHSLRARIHARPRRRRHARPGRRSRASRSSPSEARGCSIGVTAPGSRRIPELERVYFKQVSEARDQGCSPARSASPGSQPEDPSSQY